MDQHDDNPNGESYAAMTPDRDVEIDRIRTGTQKAYAGAHRVARSTLETIGDPAVDGWAYDGERAERTVSLVLGAALLELEAPWRDALEHANASRDALARSLALLEGELTETRRRLETSETAYRYVSSIKAEQRETRISAERDREAARDLAVRLEGELAELTHVAGVLLDQAGTATDGADRVHVRREALDRLAALLVEIDGTTEETDR